jgi:hypothetical protein
MWAVGMLAGLFSGAFILLSVEAIRAIFIRGENTTKADDNVALASIVSAAFVGLFLTILFKY